MTDRAGLGSCDHRRWWAGQASPRSPACRRGGFGRRDRRVRLQGRSQRLSETWMPGGLGHADARVRGLRGSQELATAQLAESGVAAALHEKCALKFGSRRSRPIFAVSQGLHRRSAASPGRTVEAPRSILTGQGRQCAGSGQQRLGLQLSLLNKAATAPDHVKLIRMGLEVEWSCRALGLMQVRQSLEKERRPDDHCRLFEWCQQVVDL